MLNVSHSFQCFSFLFSQVQLCQTCHFTAWEWRIGDSEEPATADTITVCSCKKAVNFTKTKEKRQREDMLGDLILKTIQYVCYSNWTGFSRYMKIDYKEHYQKLALNRVKRVRTYTFWSLAEFSNCCSTLVYLLAI